MSATRSSRNADRSLSLAVTGDFFHFLVSLYAQRLRDDLDVLVAATGEVQDEVLTPPQLPRYLLRVEDGVRCLERGDDAFEPRTQGKGLERLLVGDAGVLGEALVSQVGVLGA